MQASGRAAPQHLPGSTRSDCVMSACPQVERLETKVVKPLKLYGVQMKQTQVSTALRRGPRGGLGPQESTLLLP